MYHPAKSDKILLKAGTPIIDDVYLCYCLLIQRRNIYDIRTEKILFYGFLRTQYKVFQNLRKIVLLFGVMARRISNNLQRRKHTSLGNEINEYFIRVSCGFNFVRKR